MPRVNTIEEKVTCECGGTYVNKNYAQNQHRNCISHIAYAYKKFVKEGSIVDAKYDELKDENNKLQKQIKELETTELEELSELKTKVEEQTKTIEEQTKTISEKDETINQQTTALKEQQDSIYQLKLSLNFKITQLSNKIIEQNKIIDDKNKMIDEKNKMIDELKNPSKAESINSFELVSSIPKPILSFNHKRYQSIIDNIFGYHPKLYVSKGESRYAEFNLIRSSFHYNYSDWRVTDTHTTVHNKTERITIGVPMKAIDKETGLEKIYHIQYHLNIKDKYIYQITGHNGYENYVLVELIPNKNFY